MKLSLIFFFSIILYTLSYSQETTQYKKFGKITSNDLQKNIYSIDSGANAIILSDVGSTEIEGNTDGWFSFITKRHTVKHILNKNGYDEANVQIYLYFDENSEEKITNLKAVTYNLENGNVVETKLEKSNQFVEKVNKNRKIVKFTMPQVKEGCIIEYQYEIKSDFINVVDPWYFQSLSAPTLWSEFNFSVPNFLIYNVESRGYLPMTYNEKTEKNTNFYITERVGSYSLDNPNLYRSTQRINLNSVLTNFRWVIKNVPQLKTENFTSSIKNHISRMEFQLAGQREPLKYADFTISWEALVKQLSESPNFGQNLNTNNNWMNNEVRRIYAGETNNYNKAKAIFEYVRDNYKCNGKQGVYMSQELKSVFKDKSGSIAEINLLLTSMLKYANLEADPVILSTKWHGFALESSPIINSMNYVVVQFTDGNNVYYLDATQPRLGFNTLPAYCYNGYARVVNKSATSLYLNSDGLKENKKTTFFIANMLDGKWAGAVNQELGTYQSFSTRQQIAESGRENFFKEIQKNYGTTATLSEPELDSLENYELPVTVKYKLGFDTDGMDILYINPTFGEGLKKNPFSASRRNYPVEMPFSQDETIIATIEVPDGYAVDELPQQVLVNYDEEGKSFFEYRIRQSKNNISFLNRIKLNKAFFTPDEYDMLREFFTIIVKKQSEQIVFKKIK